MNPLGIALTFLLFGMLIGAGIYMALQGLGGLLRYQAFSLAFMARTETRSLRELATIFTDTILLLAGLGMIYLGVAWTYIVVYR